MALKKKTVDAAFKILADADRNGFLTPTTGAEYKRLGAAALVARSGLTIAAAGTTSGLSDRIRMVERALAACESATETGWNVDGIPGTNPASIAQTFDTGVAKAATTMADAVLSRLIGA